jgi:hypothetical protein
MSTWIKIFLIYNETKIKDVCQKEKMTLEIQRGVFISYSRANKGFAIKLAKDLQSDGYPIWLDQLNIPTGARWDDEVEKALRECEDFMVILTPASIASENVKDEIGYAIDHGKRIVPVLLEDCDVPLRLRRFQYVDFTNKPYEDGLEDIKRLTASHSPVIHKEVQTEKPSIAPTSQKRKQIKSAPRALIIGISLMVISIFGAIFFLWEKSSTLSPVQSPQASKASPKVTSPIATPTKTTPTKTSPTAAPPASHETLNSNTNPYLYVGQSLTSINGKYNLRINPDGNLVELEDGNPIWSTRTDGNTDVNFLHMQEDGNLVLYGKNLRIIWASNTSAGNPVQEYKLVLQDDGNLVVYTYTGAVVWASGTSR